MLKFKSHPLLKTIPNGVNTVSIRLPGGAIPHKWLDSFAKHFIFLFKKTNLPFYLTKTAGRIRLHHLEKLGLGTDQGTSPSSLDRARSNFFPQAPSLASGWPSIWVHA